MSIEFATRNMNTNIKKILIPLLLITGYLLPVTAFRARAQKLGLSISPPLLEVMIQPGKSFIQAYELTNNSDTNLNLQAVIKSFVPSDKHGGIEIVGDELSAPSGGRTPPLQSDQHFFKLNNSNISLNQTFKLPAGSKQQLVLSISIPENTREQDFYYIFLIQQTGGETLPRQSGGENLINIGSNILLTISQSGTPTQHGEITKFSAEPKYADLGQKITFTNLIQNTGNSFFKPDGQIEITNLLTKKLVKTLNLRPDNILVNSSRQIPCLDNLGTPCSFSSWLPGKYQAELNIKNIGKTQSIYFYILPTKSFLAVLIIILILVKTKDLTKKKINAVI